MFGLDFWELAVALFAPGILMWAGHYTPLGVKPGRELHPILRYAIGTGTIWAVYTLIVWDESAILLGLIIVSAGLMTMGAYLLDHFVGLRAGKQEHWRE